MSKLTRRLAVGALATFAAAGACRAQDLTALSLEDLLSQDSSSVAKRPQVVSTAPAAVFVIEREDIRRSGATTLPDLLRMVPGVEVASLGEGRWAVSARGFNNELANKLLVLVDGRAIYLTGSSSVPWDQQLVPVEDIERIEVVRGPGAALWGANAVNGVINIVTKQPVDSLGGAATAQVDTGDSGRIYLRQGFRVGETGTLRLSGVAHKDSGQAYLPGFPIEDRFRGAQLGFRYDAAPTERDAVTAQGDMQRGDFKPSFADGSTGPLGGLPIDGKFSSENLLGRWTHTTGSAEHTALQVYVDRLDRVQAGSTFTRSHFDIDFSQEVQLGERHNLIWGVGYRRTENRSEAGSVFGLQNTNDNLVSSFVQDDIALIPKRLTLSLGGKLEHNTSDGIAFEPSVRAIWTDPAGWSAWGAVSRAVRTPSDLEDATVADLRPGAPYVFAPGPVNSEVLTAFETGWRGRVLSNVTLDVTAYYNRYQHLIAFAGRPAVVDGGFAFLFTPANLTQARSYGVEASLEVRLQSWWKVQASASWLDLKTDPILVPFVSFGTLGAEHSPKDQLSVRSMIDLGDKVDLDVWVRHVGALGNGAAKAYSNLDLRLAWRPTPTLELSLRGTNVFGRRSSELGPDIGSTIGAAAGLPDRRLQITAAVRY